jgi:hypothetical protein
MDCWDKTVLMSFHDAERAGFGIRCPPLRGKVNGGHARRHFVYDLP